MKIKIGCLLLGLFVISCAKQQQMKIARSDFSVIEKMENHSPIYISEEKGRISVNRTSSIGSTNWIFSVERELNAQAVLKEVKNLKDKKYSGKIHPDDEGVYFIYMDTMHKSMAFLPFAETQYVTEAIIPKDLPFLSYKGNLVFEYQNKAGKIETLGLKDAALPVVFKVSPELSFEEYIQAKVLLAKDEQTKKYLSKTEVIY